MITPITETTKLMGISYISEVLDKNSSQASLLEKTYDWYFAIHRIILDDVRDILNAYFNDKFYDFKQQDIE